MPERGVYLSDAPDGTVALVLRDRHGTCRARLEVAASDWPTVCRIWETFSDSYLDLLDPSIRLVK